MDPPSGHRGRPQSTAGQRDRAPQGEMMVAKTSDQWRPVIIRNYLRDAEGEASVGDLYEHLIDGAGYTLRQVNRALHYLEKRGEIIVQPDCTCRLVEKQDRGSTPAVLWRTAQQLSLRGAFSAKDLMQVSGIDRWGTQEWLQEMRRRSLIRETGKFRYRVARDAPNRDDPPAFRWPRRGKARASWDNTKKVNSISAMQF